MNHNGIFAELANHDVTLINELDDLVNKIKILIKYLRYYKKVILYEFYIYHKCRN